MKRKILVVALVAMFLMTGMAFAQEMAAKHNPPPGHMHKGHMMGRMKGHPMTMHNINRFRQKLTGSFFLDPMCIEKLKLTDAQIDELVVMKAQHQKEAISVRGKLQAEAIDLKLLMRKIDMDVPKVRAQMTKVEDLKVRLKVHRLYGFQKAQKVLTSTQKKTLNDMWLHPGKPHRRGMGMGKHRNCGSDCKCKNHQPKKPGKGKMKSENGSPEQISMAVPLEIIEVEMVDDVEVE